MEIFPLNIWYPIKWSLLHLKTYLNLFLVIRAIFTKKKSQCINALLQPRRTSDSLLALVHSSLVDYLAHVIYAKKTIPSLCKISACTCFLSSQKTIFSYSVPPLNSFNFFIQMGGPLWKKCFLWAKETHSNILRGGPRNPIQLKNAIKRGGTGFWLYHMG